MWIQEYFRLNSLIVIINIPLIWFFNSIENGLILQATIIIIIVLLIMFPHKTKFGIIKAFLHSLLELWSVLTLIKEIIGQLPLSLNPSHSFVRVWVLQEPVRVANCCQLTTVHVIDIQLIATWRKMIGILKLPVLPLGIVYDSLLVNFEPIVPVDPEYGHSWYDG